MIVSVTNRQPLIAVTPPVFSRSAILREELLQSFPNAIFNPKDQYMQGAELIEFLSQAEGAIVGRDHINAETLARLPRLKVIAKYGVGMDTIDSTAFDHSQVALRVTPGVNKNSVAELTICFIIGLLHNVFSVGFDLKRGVWRKEGGVQLLGKTVGIVGCGHIGERLIEILIPFSCNVLVHDIVSKAEVCEKYGAREVNLDTLCREADILTFHVPLTAETHRMVDENFLYQMKPSACLVNTSRGAVIDFPALKEALITGRIAGAAVDVFDPEPPEDDELLALHNFMGTPHIGGNTLEATLAMGRAPMRQLIDFFQMES
ncbi:MAG: hydroxyacid dehydrogenase [Nitrospinae bacterium CG11_big_fil_rev_8_21_14_0_20_45_15]|nr:MAG: hydroxyacid dehydrogenase [Nitrospinae bacterium CG11_big_fil_rev_8_21_14_0_20_45_15]